jgi:hypothetical protein
MNDLFLVGEGKAAATDTGVVESYVEAAERLQRGVNHSEAVGVITDVDAIVAP